MSDEEKQTYKDIASEDNEKNGIVSPNRKKAGAKTTNGYQLWLKKCKAEDSTMPLTEIGASWTLLSKENPEEHAKYMELAKKHNAELKAQTSVEV